MKFATVVAALSLAAAIAPGLLGQGSRPAMEVSGRIVVEPAYPSPFPGEITLAFTNAAGTSVEDVTLSETIKSTNFRPVRGGFTGEVRLQKDGKFLVLLPNSPAELRVIVRLRPSASAATATSGRYFIKSVQAGKVNLLQKPLVLTSPFPDELLISLAKCTEQTQSECK
jgi:hypothetical protein